MTSKTKKFLKIGAILLIAGLLAGGGAIYYMFNMPHRNIQKTDADYTLTTTQIVNEYITDKTAANEKYLAADGDSKVLAITGTVSKISEDFNGQKVVLLKNEADKAGVSCSFTAETNKSTETLKIGQTATIKGVIRSGASYDEDLEMYENVIIEKSDIQNSKQ